MVAETPVTTQEAPSPQPGFPLEVVCPRLCPSVTGRGRGVVVPTIPLLKIRLGEGSTRWRGDSEGYAPLPWLGSLRTEPEARTWVGCCGAIPGSGREGQASEGCIESPASGDP